MRRLFGFALFWVAVGMTMSLLIENTIFVVCIIVACLIVGFNLFCGKPWKL